MIDGSTDIQDVRESASFKITFQDECHSSILSLTNSTTSLLIFQLLQVLFSVLQHFISAFGFPLSIADFFSCGLAENISVYSSVIETRCLCCSTDPKQKGHTRKSLGFLFSSAVGIFVVSCSFQGPLSAKETCL